MAHTTNNM